MQCMCEFGRSHSEYQGYSKKFKTVIPNVGLTQLLQLYLNIMIHKNNLSGNYG